MNKTASLAILVSLGLFSSAFAKSDLPKIITDGFTAYQTTGSKDALITWLKGSPVEKDAATNSNMNALLAQVEMAYGKMSGFEPVKVVSISPSVQRIYLVIRFERGPLYALFDCYKSVQDKPTLGWIVNNLECNISAKAVLPPGILESGAPKPAATAP